MTRIDDIRSELRAAAADSPYRAMNTYWLCLVRLANMHPHAGEEHEQIASVMRRFSRSEAAAVVAGSGVDRLLTLQPPLETILAEPRERLAALQAQKELERVRARRSSDPKAALLSLFEVLQRIRDKREHGFKSPNGPRDTEILSAAISVLKPVCELMVDKTRAFAESDLEHRRGA